MQFVVFVVLLMIKTNISSLSEYSLDPDFSSTCPTYPHSSIQNKTLGETSWARLTTELIRGLRILCGDTAHSNLGHLVRFSNYVRTLYKIL